MTSLKGVKGSVAIVGAGVMGETLLAGLIRAGMPRERLLITEKRADRAKELANRHGVGVVSNTEAADKAQVLVLVVKPQDMAAVAEELAPSITTKKLVISLAAGITTASLEARFAKGVPVIRVMPNTPALVDKGMAAVSLGSSATAAHSAIAEALMSSVGKVVTVPEKQQDAVTAVSGSGPAYVFYVVEAMIEAGVLLGLPRATATELTIQTVVGAAAMLDETGEHPTVLREQVSSPAGTTIAALRQLDDHKVRAAFLTAMEAARDRSRELAAGD